MAQHFLRRLAAEFPSPFFNQEFFVLPLNDFIALCAKVKPEPVRCYILIAINSKATGQINIDDRQLDLQPRSVFLVAYHQIFSFSPEASAEGSVLVFTRSFYNLIYTGNRRIRHDTAFAGLPPFVKPEKRQFSQFRQTILNINEEYHHAAQASKEIICLELKVLVLRYMRSTGDTRFSELRTDHKQSCVEEFRRLIDKHFRELKRTSDYAEKMGLSPNYLNALVREKTDMTAERLIRHRVILEAQRLLLNTDYSAAEIGFELGFSDKSHFGRYFKRITGESPNSFRQNFPSGEVGKDDETSS